MTTIYTFAQSAIEEARSAGRYGTANLYSGAINSFRNFTGDIPLTFKEVTAGMIKRYEESLLQKGRRHNTISAYMRMLRSIQPGIPARHSRYDTCRRAVPLRIHRLRAYRQTCHLPRPYTASLATESGTLSPPALQPRFIPAQLLPERHSVCRPGSSPQNGHEAQHHLLLPPQDPPAAIGLPRTVRRRDSATLHRQALPLSLPSAHTLSGRSGRLPAVQKRTASLQPAPAPAIQDAAPECAAHLLRGTPQLGHHRQRRRSSHRHDKRRAGTQFRKGNTRIPLFF